MKVNRSTGYGFLALGYIVKHRDEGTILSHDIAKEQNIPLEYLLKIMQQLVRANILRSKRGPHGGFSLARPIGKITMLDVIEAIEGPISGQLNLAERTPKEGFNVKAEQAYQRAIDQAKAAFKRTKMSDLI